MSATIKEIQQMNKELVAKFAAELEEIAAAIDLHEDPSIAEVVEEVPAAPSVVVEPVAVEPVATPASEIPSTEEELEDEACDVECNVASELVVLAKKVLSAKEELTAAQRLELQGDIVKLASKLAATEEASAKDEESEDESITSILKDIISKKSKFTKALGKRKVSFYTKELPQVSQMTVADLFKALEAVYATF